MGRLVTLENLEPDATWYFPDARYSWESRRWIYSWPNDRFPHEVAIHDDDFKNHPECKCDIRRWIDINFIGTVIVRELSKNYRVYYGEDRDWDRSFERSNLWHVFYFEDSESALLFRLKFSEFVKEITELHPSGSDKYEETSYYSRDKLRGLVE